MDDLKANLFPNTPISSLLILKPISMEWLATCGIDPFHQPKATLEEVYRRLGMEWEDFLEALGELEEPHRDSNWKSLPLCHLIEFLTREHREFKHVFIPAIKSAFAAGDGKRDFLGPLLPLVKAWPGFSATLLEHIGFEEALLFPKILRDQYRMLHGQESPASAYDSTQGFPSLMFLGKEGEHAETIRRYLDSASFCCAPESMEMPAVSVYRLLHHFQERLIGHSRVERDFLLPRAAMAEKRLRDRSIAAFSGIPAPRPRALVK
jgi:iron-sulfur cluster repair protein YtfE (RIC family)